MGAPGVTPTGDASSRYTARGPQSRVAGGSSSSRGSCGTTDALASARMMACTARAAGLGACHTKGGTHVRDGKGAAECMDAECVDTGCAVNGSHRGGWEAGRCGGGGVGVGACADGVSLGHIQSGGGVGSGCSVGGCLGSGCGVRDGGRGGVLGGVGCEGRCGSGGGSRRGCGCVTTGACTAHACSDGCCACCGGVGGCGVGGCLCPLCAGPGAGERAMEGLLGIGWLGKGRGGDARRGRAGRNGVESGSWEAGLRDAYRTTLSQVCARFEAERAQAELEHEEAFGEQARKHHSRVAATQAELDATKAAHQQEVASLKASMQKELESTKAAHQQEVAALKAALQGDLDSTKAAHQQEVTNLKAAMQKELDSTKAAHQQEVANLKAAMQKELDSTKVALEEVTRREALAGGPGGFATLQQENKELKAAVARLEEERVTSLQYQLYLQRAAAESQKQDGHSLKERLAELEQRLEEAGAEGALQAAMHREEQARLHAQAAKDKEGQDRLKAGLQNREAAYRALLQELHALRHGLDDEGGDHAQKERYVQQRKAKLPQAQQSKAKLHIMRDGLDDEGGAHDRALLQELHAMHNGLDDEGGNHAQKGTCNKEKKSCLRHNKAKQSKAACHARWAG
ncbi:hypothetical protein DUNSADRAFT_1942 [Dunaliella salina]|uniref:Uncharacterized protein n=1 Tax=Dunaliella salina TaxID=3046 RepID=A0ABQ7GWD9_DUNSA|nr:hypothetical protein DUNSADRAFT_1942 [Dunaliella salina]|eukprot:KAF5838926.1 hypothetical protein DUNSADRAFT_1942 [Dunaliella salina]